MQRPVPQSPVPSPQSSVLSPQLLSPQSSVLSPQSPVLSPQSSVPSPQSSVLSPQSFSFASSLPTPLLPVLRLHEMQKVLAITVLGQRFGNFPNLRRVYVI